MRHPATLDAALRPALLGLVRDEVTRYALDRLVGEVAESERTAQVIGALLALYWEKFETCRRRLITQDAALPPGRYGTRDGARSED